MEVQDFASTEDVQTALLNLERLRELEQSLRQEAEYLLEGRRILTRPASAKAIFTELAAVFQKIIGFEKALLLLPVDDSLRVKVSTDDSSIGQRCAVGPVFQRVLDGETIAIAEVRNLPEWNRSALAPEAASVLLSALRTENLCAFVVCTHSEASFFSPSHLRLVQRFTPLATQALVNIDARRGRFEKARLLRAQRQAEQRLSLLEKVTDALGIGIAIRDPGNALGWVSPALESLVRAWDSPAAWWSQVRKLSPPLPPQDSTRAAKALEIELPSPGGGERWFQLTFSAQHHGDAGQIVLVADVTERARAVRRLRQSEARKSAILETALDCILTLDHKGRILEFNPAAETTFGYHQEEAIGRSMVELLIPEEHREGHRDDMRRYLETSLTVAIGQRLELTAQSRSGRQFPAELAITQISTEGQPILTAYLRDITERREAEEAMRAAKEAAEEGSRLKSQFLAGVSHELRTPLNVILGMTELTRDGELSQDQAECLRLVDSSSKSLLRLIDDILDASRIEAGQMQLEMLTFSPRELIEESVKSLQPIAQGKGLELRWEVQDGVPKALRGDASRFRQVLLNLVGNGIKFTDRGHVAVVLAAKSPRNEASAGSVELHLSVTDTGIGIPQEEQKRIFERFLQLDRSTTRRYGGAGLGLGISKAILELMGGRLWVESQTGSGSTFHGSAILAIADAAELASARESETRSQPASTGQNAQVLLVEDNLDNQKLIARFLDRAGHHLQTRSSGLEALEALEAHPDRHFDLVLMDVEMPAMDGLETTRRVRLQEEKAGRGRVPIIALTAHAGKDFQKRCSDAGMDGYLAKPFDRSKLLEIVQLWTVANSESEPPEPPRPSLLETCIDEDLRDLLPGFLKQKAQDVRKIPALLETGRLAEIRNIGHNLKGSGQLYGFPELTRIGRRLEEAAKEEANDEVLRCQQQLVAQFGQIETRFPELGDTEASL